MILLTTSLSKAQECASAIQNAFNEPVVVAGSLHEAAERLQAQAFSVVLFDQLLLDAEPDDGEAALRHLGSAFPVYMNFAVTGVDRMIRDLRSAMRRRKQDLTAAREEAEHLLHHELKDKITALLVSCEIALQAPDLPAGARGKMNSVYEIAQQLRGKLEA